MIDSKSIELTIKEQCEMINLSRTSYYYKKKPETPFNLFLMRKIDEIHTKHITWGSRKIRDYFINLGYKVNRKRIQRLMRMMQLQVLYPKQNLSKRNHEHRIFPYLLRNLNINKPNQVWCTDITYIRLDHGFVYLVAIMDWYSKKILSWELSNTADRFFCISALEQAMRLHGKPEIFNSDQGSQFTSPDFIKVLKDSEIKISMDGKGRALDNVAIERFWRTLKYDEVYLHEYQNMKEAKERIEIYINEYNLLRPHQTLSGSTPDKVYYSDMVQDKPA